MSLLHGDCPHLFLKINVEYRLPIHITLLLGAEENTSHTESCISAPRGANHHLVRARGFGSFFPCEFPLGGF